jgi:hypothetical protein
MWITNPIRDPLYNFTLMKMTDKEICHILRFKNFLNVINYYTFYIILQALSGHSE